MTDNIRSKVRKLLALAGDAGATDNEREVAMRKAQAMIEEHNIELGSLDDFAEQIKLTKGDIFTRGMKLPYHRVIAQWVAELYDCKHLIYKDIGGHQYWGLNHQVEAAEETFLWIVAQVEDLYRVALKAFDGQLTKGQRAELRASFKDAAAARIAARIHSILQSRKQGRDSRALVVIDTVAQKIAEELAKDQIKQAKPVALREGFGTQAGWNAGDMVRIQREVRQ
jgi:hypothetical protein